MRSLNKKAANRRDILYDNIGSTYVDTVITLVIIMMLISFTLNVFQFLMIHQKLEYFAEEMVEAASYYGKTVDEVSDRYEGLCEEIGITPDISFEGTEYFNSQKKTVQLGDVITVNLSYTSALSGMGIFEIPVTVNISQSGLSQQYWK